MASYESHEGGQRTKQTQAPTERGGCTERKNGGGGGGSGGFP